MIVIKALCFLFCVFRLIPAYAQNVKSTQHIQQTWLGFLNQTRLTDKWGIWLDVHLRTREDFTTNLSQSIVRFGLTYYLNEVTKLTAGYAYVNQFPTEDHKNISRPEHRPWQQLQWHTEYGKKRMMQWIRLDERFRHKILNDSALAQGYNFNYKVRYNLWYDIPLNKKGIVPKALSFVVTDEIHINFGKQIIHNYFDQNRFFAGLKLQSSVNANIQAGYMNLFQQLPAGYRYRNIHAFRVFYSHNFDLRNKD